jgi:Phage integrase family
MVVPIGYRGHGSLSFEHRGECQDPKWQRRCTGLWRGVTSEMLDGQRVRVKVSAKTKAEAQTKDSMRRLTKAAGLGESWTPRELRHTFVSIASEAGVPIEEIAALAGHSTTRTTELVYRKELRPVLSPGEARKTFDLIADELMRVDLAGRHTWVLAAGSADERAHS